MKGIDLKMQNRKVKIIKYIKKNKLKTQVTEKHMENEECITKTKKSKNIAEEIHGRRNAHQKVIETLQGSSKTRKYKRRI